jgi:metalloendopeptidase OMA1, mitochondrial
MARACYNPEEAIGLWKRMSEALPKNAEFLSTHPAPDSRISAIEGWMDEANQERMAHCFSGNNNS